MILSDEIKAAIKEDALKALPRECCGLILLKDKHLYYKPCQNLAEKNDFIIGYKDWAEAEDEADIIAIVHSHKNSPEPTQVDLASCEKHKKPWIIYGCHTDSFYEFSPTGYRAPLKGRPFKLGVYDCYSLCRDFYYEKLGIVLPDRSVGYKWWERGENLIEEGIASAGFKRVDDDTPQLYDGVLMAIGSTNGKSIINHVGVISRDNILLHHAIAQRSMEEVYGGWYRDVTRYFVRYERS